MQTTIMVWSMGNNDNPTAGRSILKIDFPSSQPRRNMQTAPSRVVTTIRKS